MSQAESRRVRLINNCLRCSLMHWLRILCHLSLSLPSSLELTAVRWERQHGRSGLLCVYEWKLHCRLSTSRVISRYHWWCLPPISVNILPGATWWHFYTLTASIIALTRLHLPWAFVSRWLKYLAVTPAIINTISTLSTSGSVFCLIILSKDIWNEKFILY